MLFVCFQESADKTSSACQRRVTHSLKNQSTKQNLMVYLSEAMQDPVSNAAQNQPDDIPIGGHDIFC